MQSFKIAELYDSPTEICSIDCFESLQFFHADTRKMESFPGKVSQERVFSVFFEKEI